MRQIERGGETREGLVDGREGGKCLIGYPNLSVCWFPVQI